MGNGCCCCPGSSKEQPDLGSPIKKRSCTDVLCLIIFFLYWGGMIAILVYSVVFGRVLRLLNGYDDYGNTCGIKNNDPSIANKSVFANMDHTDRPYQFFMNYYNIPQSYAVCVKECPSVVMNNMNDVFSFYNSTKSALCDYSVRPEDYRSQASCALHPQGCFGPCPAFVLPVEVPYLHRCLPKAFIDDPVGLLVNNTRVDDIAKFFGQYKFFSDFGASFYTVRYDLLILLATALGISLVLVFLMRFVIKIVVWFIVVLTALAAIGGTTVLWVVYYRLTTGIDPQKTHQLPLLGIAVDAQKAFLGYSITATILTVILLLVIIVMRKRLQLAVALFQEAGKVLESSPFLLVQPAWTYLYHVLVVAFGLLMLILLSGVTNPGDPITRDVIAGNRSALKFYDRPEVTYFWWYVVIGIIWMMEFANAIQELIIAGAVAEWFFTRDKTKLSCTLGSATGRTIANHLGSAAFGSFIITLVRIPRYILMKMHEKVKDSGNECAKFMLKCCICCLWCLEKCLRYINRNAYIVIAISGTNFCAAKIKAFKTLLDNILRVIAINTVGDFVLFLGKVLVMAANVVIAFFLFDRYNQNKVYGERNIFFLPTLVVAIFSYLIAHCFLSSFEMLVDTLLLCFCEDVKLNDGSADKPYYMSKSLMKFVADSSKALNEKKKLQDHPDGDASERAILSHSEASPATEAPDNRK